MQVFGYFGVTGKQATVCIKGSRLFVEITGTDIGIVSNFVIFIYTFSTDECYFGMYF